MIWLHLITFSPSAIINSLWLIFGKDNPTREAGFLANAVIWLVAYGTANVGVATLSWGFLFFVIQWLLHIMNLTYWLLLIGYTAFAIYTMWF